MDALTLDDVRDLYEAWNENPPWQECVKQFLGVKPAEPVPSVDATPKEMTAEEWEREKAAGLAFAQAHGHVRGF